MSNEEQQGSVPPYGDAIAKAAQRGDLEDMEAHADAARHAIAGEPPPEGAAVKFHKVLDHEVAAVRGALHELENKIAELRKRKE
ncbi:MAG TPA: hypothetical protein VGU66_21725 [Candidatus Elarobacter sp.]|nr:hypothetical protein [Candidatus Elarobacter sp.]